MLEHLVRTYSTTTCAGFLPAAQRGAGILQQPAIFKYRTALLAQNIVLVAHCCAEKNADFDY